MPPTGTETGNEATIRVLATGGPVGIPVASVDPMVGTVGGIFAKSAPTTDVNPVVAVPSNVF